MNLICLQYLIEFVDRFFSIQRISVKAFWEGRKVSDGDPSFTPDKLNTIKGKWLLVNGDNDDPVPFQLAVEMHRSIPNARLWIVPNGWHLPHLEPDNQSDLLRRSLEFLNGKWDKNE